VGLKGYKKPGEIVAALKSRVPFKITTETHTRAWKYYEVRPAFPNPNPEKTKPQYCVYDELGGMYGYTEAWIDLLVEALANPDKYREITGRDPIPVTLSPTIQTAE